MDSYLFVPPKWCRGLKNIPKKRFKLSQTPSVIHKWNLPGVKDEYEVFIKRDDMIGAGLSGNKVRKLDFILAEAVDMGCDCVITTGGIQSNHARTTAIAAREVGLDSHLVLLPTAHKPEDTPVSSNMLLDRLVGAHVYLESEYDGDIFVAMNRMMSSVKEKLILQNKKPYVIGVGGAGVTGSWAYIEAFQEMIEQGVVDNFDDIIVPISTGGTAVGLAIGNYLNGSKLRVHAVLVANTVEVKMVYRQMNTELFDLGLVDENGQLVRAEDIVDVIDGYANDATQDDMAMLCDISTSTGIILDTVFTQKAVKGMLCEMKKTPDRFKGHRILFLHTGGMFSNTSGILEETLLKTKDTSNIIRLSDIVNC